jgi:hypothetical protein
MPYEPSSSSFEDFVYADDGEAASQSAGCLSVFLRPLFSTLVFGSLLFWGLTQFTFFSTATPLGQGHLAPFFAPQVQRWEPQILAWSAEHNLDPNLVATVMQIESCGDPRATSRAGAMGLFQVMPYHFASGENAYEPATNAARGLDYLTRSLDAFSGNAAMALAGYNGGINGASRPMQAWAQETIDYQYWGENIYADAAAGRSESPVLVEWLGAGGASLCAQAETQLAASP